VVFYFELHPLGDHDNRASVLAFVLPAALLQASGNTDFIPFLYLLATELGNF
jgi:hypothetical protein